MMKGHAWEDTKVSPIGNEGSRHLKAVIIPAGTSGSTKKSFLSRVIVYFGFLFGLDFSSCNGNRPIWKRILSFVVCLILWIIPWIAFKFTLNKACECYELRFKYIKPLQCVDDYMAINNAIDAVMGVYCTLSLLINRCTIAQMFVMILEPFDESNDENVNKHLYAKKEGRKIKIGICVVSCFMVFVCLVLPTLSVVGNQMINLADFALTVMSDKMELVKVVSNIPSSVLATYFVILYAFVCYVLDQHMNQLRKKAPNMNYQDFCLKLSQCQGFVNMAEAAFSQILPIYYIFQILTAAVWIMFVNWEDVPEYNDNEFKYRCIHLVMHLFQIGLLIIPPIMVNNQLSMPIEGPMSPSGGRVHHIGVFAADDFKEQKRVGTQMSSRHCYLTAGGIRISTWFIPAMISVGVVLMMVNYKIEFLLKKIDKVVRDKLKAMPTPKPVVCPTCPSFIEKLEATNFISFSDPPFQGLNSTLSNNFTFEALNFTLYNNFSSENLNFTSSSFEATNLTSVFSQDPGTIPPA